MANLDDLNYPSISDMSIDEALETIRQIRLSRRAPRQVTKTTTTRSKPKPIQVSAEDAADLLKILTGGK